MIQIFMTEDGAIHQKDEMQSGAWIALTNPTATEILEISETCGIDPDQILITFGHLWMMKNGPVSRWKMITP